MERVSFRSHCLALILLSLTISGCEPSGSRQAVLSDESGSHKLVYDCSAFRAQAESADDLRVLALALSETMRHAADHGNVVTAQSLQNAYQQKDWRTIERLIIQYRCSNRADFPNR